MSTLPTRDDAIELLKRYISSDYTVKHSLASEAILRGLARKLGHDEDLWGITGLLHDLDYEEIDGDPKRHGLRTAEILKEMDYPAEGVDAIRAHNGDELDIPCVTPLDFGLTAGESISGLIFATALILPSKNLADVKPKSVRKRIKEKRFAAKISRERIGQFEGLGLTQEEFVTIAVEAMQNADLK
ncbi:MAG: HDIG domain-containing protein [Deltaproteobacteria bacterium]|nr:HDIG domain-containing protein [Deltaproteobacteria bacterium]